MSLIFKIKKQQQQQKKFGQTWGMVLSSGLKAKLAGSWQLPMLPDKLIRRRVGMCSTCRAEYFIWSYQRISNFGFTPRNSCQVNPKVKAKVISDNKMAEFHPTAEKKGEKRGFWQFWFASIVLNHFEVSQLVPDALNTKRRSHSLCSRN